MYTGLHVKYPLFLSKFNETCIFSTDSRKILISNSMETRPVEAELLHGACRIDTQAGKETDVTKVTVAFHNARTRLKMWLF